MKTFKDILQHIPGGRALDVATGAGRFVEILKIIPGNYQDVKARLDELAGDPRVDCNRVGITGISLGSFHPSLLAMADVMQADMPHMSL